MTKNARFCGGWTSTPGVVRPNLRSMIFNKMALKIKPDLLKEPSKVKDALLSAYVSLSPIEQRIYDSFGLGKKLQQLEPEEQWQAFLKLPYRRKRLRFAEGYDGGQPGQMLQPIISQPPLPPSYPVIYQPPDDDVQFRMESLNVKDEPFDYPYIPFPPDEDMSPPPDDDDDDDDMPALESQSSSSSYSPPPDDDDDGGGGGGGGGGPSPPPLGPGANGLQAINQQNIFNVEVPIRKRSPDPEPVVISSGDGPSPPPPGPGANGYHVISERQNIFDVPVPVRRPRPDPVLISSSDRKDPPPPPGAGAAALRVISQLPEGTIHVSYVQNRSPSPVIMTVENGSPPSSPPPMANGTYSVPEAVADQIPSEMVVELLESEDLADVSVNNPEEVEREIQEELNRAPEIVERCEPEGCETVTFQSDKEKRCWILLSKLAEASRNQVIRIIRVYKKIISIMTEPDPDIQRLYVGNRRLYSREREDITPNLNPAEQGTYIRDIILLISGAGVGGVVTYETLMWVLPKIIDAVVRCHEFLLTVPDLAEELMYSLADLIIKCLLALKVPIFYTGIVAGSYLGMFALVVGESALTQRFIITGTEVFSQRYPVLTAIWFLPLETAAIFFKLLVVAPIKGVASLCIYTRPFWRKVLEAIIKGSRATLTTLLEMCSKIYLFLSSCDWKGNAGVIKNFFLGICFLALMFIAGKLFVKLRIPLRVGSSMPLFIIMSVVLSTVAIGSIIMLLDSGASEPIPQWQLIQQQQRQDEEGEIIFNLTDSARTAVANRRLVKEEVPNPLSFTYPVPIAVPVVKPEPEPEPLSSMLRRRGWVNVKPEPAVVFPPVPAELEGQQQMAKNESIASRFIRGVRRGSSAVGRGVVGLGRGIMDYLWRNDPDEARRVVEEPQRMNNAEQAIIETRLRDFDDFVMKVRKSVPNSSFFFTSANVQMIRDRIMRGETYGDAQYRANDDTYLRNMGLPPYVWFQDPQRGARWGRTIKSRAREFAPYLTPEEAAANTNLSNALYQF